MDREFCTPDDDQETARERNQRMTKRAGSRSELRPTPGAPAGAAPVGGGRDGRTWGEPRSTAGGYYLLGVTRFRNP